MFAGINIFYYLPTNVEMEENMLEKSKISVTRTRRRAAAKEFSFTAKSIPVGGLKDVRAKAWDIFSKFSR